MAIALFKFFIVKSGEIEILDYSGDEPKTITVHRKGQFTGDISHLTGTPAIFTAIARGDCEVFEISGEALRHVLNQCPGLSDIILQAFIARRQLLRESPNFIGLRVIGSRYSPGYVSGARFSGQESRALHLGGSGDGSAGGSAC